MTPVFIDTSFLLALVLRKDEHHERALRWQEKVIQPLLTTEFVLIEFVDAMSANEICRRAGIDTVDLLRAAAEVQIVSLSTGLLNDALRFFSRRPDKQWSLTDCTSFLTMQSHAISEALTSDHHFEQAGFTALLRRDPE